MFLRVNFRSLSLWKTSALLKINKEKLPLKFSFDIFTLHHSSLFNFILFFVDVDSHDHLTMLSLFFGDSSFLLLTCLVVSGKSSVSKI